MTSSIVRAALVAATLATAFGPRVQAVTNPSACVSAISTCRFSCTAGETVTIDVFGSGTVQGVATCGSAVARCGPISAAHCEGSDWTSTGDLAGYCDLSNGTVAICTATPSPQRTGRG